MTYQEYLRKTNELIAQKNALYDSTVYGNDNSAIYAEIDGIDAELNALVNPNDEPLTDDDDLMLLLGKDDIGNYEDVETKHNWMSGTY